MMASENGHTAVVGTWLAAAFPSMGCEPPCASSVTGSRGSRAVPLLVGALGWLPHSCPLSTGPLPHIAGLCAAAFQQQLSLLLSEFLLYQAKANITVLDVNKNTALHLACSKVGSRPLAAVIAVTITFSLATLMREVVRLLLPCQSRGAGPGLALPACLPVLTCTDAPDTVLSSLGCGTDPSVFFLGTPCVSSVCFLGRGGSRSLVISVSTQRRRCCRGDGGDSSLSSQALPKW